MESCPLPALPDEKAEAMSLTNVPFNKYLIRVGRKHRLTVTVSPDQKVTRIFDQKTGRNWSAELVKKAYELRMLKPGESILWLPVVKPYEAKRHKRPQLPNDLQGTSLEGSYQRLLSEHVKVVIRNPDKLVVGFNKSKGAEVHISLIASPEAPELSVLVFRGKVIAPYNMSEPRQER